MQVGQSTYLKQKIVKLQKLFTTMYKVTGLLYFDGFGSAGGNAEDNAKIVAKTTKQTILFILGEANLKVSKN